MLFITLQSYEIIVEQTYILVQNLYYLVPICMVFRHFLQLTSKNKRY